MLFQCVEARRVLLARVLSNTDLNGHG